MLTQYETFRARFAPVRRDNLKPGAQDWIGYEGEWEALWLITPEDGGAYVGEWACGLSTNERAELDLRHQAPPPFVWVPERDLVRL